MKPNQLLIRAAITLAVFSIPAQVNAATITRVFHGVVTVSDHSLMPIGNSFAATLIYDDQTPGFGDTTKGYAAISLSVQFESGFTFGGGSNSRMSVTFIGGTTNDWFSATWSDPDSVDSFSIVEQNPFPTSVLSSNSIPTLEELNAFDIFDPPHWGDAFLTLSTVGGNAVWGEIGAVTPEPSTASLAGLGLLVLGAIGRRRRVGV